MDHFECHGPCKQGRLPCPTPEACERPDPDDYGHIVTDVLVAMACVMAAAIIAITLYGAFK